VIKQFKHVSCKNIFLELYSSNLTARNKNAINLIANVYRIYSFSNFITHTTCSYFSSSHTYPNVLRLYIVYVSIS